MNEELKGDGKLLLDNYKAEKIKIIALLCTYVTSVMNTLEMKSVCTCI
jgi:hypothetical protein